MFNALSVEKINLVQSSFAELRQRGDEAAELFYGRLFELAPDVKPLFRNDMSSQGKKLMDTLDFLISSLRNYDNILPDVRKLAVKHAGYGVKTEHYKPVGEAMLWALEQTLRDDYSPAVRHAWASIYHILSQAMIDATAGKASAG